MPNQSRIDIAPVLAILAIALAPALCQAQGYTISTVAGNGSQTYSGDGGPAASAASTTLPTWRSTQPVISTSRTQVIV